MRKKLNIEPPLHLDSEARKEFRRVAVALERMGADIQAVDTALLATYSQAYSDIVRLTLAIRKEGDVVPGHRNVMRKNPRFAALRESYERLLRSAHKLGMSPASRRNMDLAPPSAPSPIDKFRMK